MIITIYTGRLRKQLDYNLKLRLECIKRNVSHSQPTNLRIQEASSDLRVAHISSMTEGVYSDSCLRPMTF